MLQTSKDPNTQESFSMTTYIIPPTVLYIKQHSVTGLKYFGKTTRDPYKYNGSGKHWVPHIKKHGRKHIITTNVFGPFTNSIAISEFALAFSKDHNIVNSDLWANQKPENGIDGGVPGIKRGPSGRKGIPNGPQQNPSNKPNGRKGISTGPNGRKGKPSGKKGIPNGRKGIPIGPHSDESKQKISDANKGKPRSAETRQKISDAQKGKPGKPHSDESKQKISDARKGKPSPLKGIPNGKKGIPTGPHSAETRQKMSDAKKKKSIIPILP